MKIIIGLRATRHGLIGRVKTMVQYSGIVKRTTTNRDEEDLKRKIEDKMKQSDERKQKGQKNL